MTSKLHLLGLTKEAYDANPAAIKVTTKPGREVGIIPAGIYGKGVDNKETVYTLGSIVGVSVNKKMDDDTAYEVTKLFWEQSKKNSETHPWLKHLTMDYAVRNGGMQLHPGQPNTTKSRESRFPPDPNKASAPVLAGRSSPAGSPRHFLAD